MHTALRKSKDRIGDINAQVQRLGNFTRLYQEGITGFERFMEILEVESDIKDAPDAIEVTNVHGNIEFKYYLDYVVVCLA
jgi:ATP-binding cassette subfamily B protein